MTLCFLQEMKALCFRINLAHMVPEKFVSRCMPEELCT